ncbi:acyl-CoA dehydrogenase family protein [Mycobacterium vicinigordonae]|uniref:Acyl-CoA/acyl-ACP dehydrogenase n=1 Tax=Mycobacterium vicinigordonae TaxID=1719132 RepID=A0A7D6I7F5_9MYCO|nr:acyl-CoA dehydrogenase family protein [Mycobacterium vicinigordonae]QLL07576.1 acyl-CoA/acyl-ACP dehydrogenase [Mycobacterium vicinigordonae]
MSEFARELTDLVRDMSKDADTTSGGAVAQRRWEQLQELGLTGIAIAENAGGSGGSLADLILVIRELARAGLNTPIVEASVAAYAVGAAPKGAFDTVVISHLAHLAPILSADLGLITFAPMARRVAIVGAAEVASLALADATVDPLVDIAGLPAGHVRVNHAPCAIHPQISPNDVLERLTLTRSAALVGSAWAAYELTRSYVVERKQFGAPLMKLMPVRTGLAHMAIGIRAAQSALDRAVELAVSVDSSPLQRFGAAASARIAAAHMATLVARTSHQLHGAVGITREYRLHRFTRSLWAHRDADRSEQDWNSRLGAVARTLDEDMLWEQLTN